MLTEEKINSNFVIYCEKLKQYGCYSQRMMDEIGNSIKVASFGLDENSGSAYCGSMIDVVLTSLCVIGAHINTNAFGIGKNGKPQHPFLLVDNNSLMKVLLLQHISKSMIFVPEDNDWFVKKGKLYKFNDSLETSLKVGERSIHLCMKYGIQLSDEEFEAMRIIDRDDLDKNNAFTTPLSLLVRMANQLTTVERYRRYRKTVMNK